MKELPVPPAARSDSSARELVRVWAAQGAQHVSLVTGLWADPAAWGLMLADLARHAARAYEQTDGLDAGEMLARIHQAFVAELQSSTDEPTGEILEEEARRP